MLRPAALLLEIVWELLLHGMGRMYGWAPLSVTLLSM